MPTQQLKLAQHYCAEVSFEPLALKQLHDLTQLMDSDAAIQKLDAPVHLPTAPVTHQTEDGQVVVINIRQVLESSSHTRLHPQSRILVYRVTDPSDFPMATLIYGVLEPARLFGEIDPLLHAAFSQTHENALLREHLLKLESHKTITTDQLVRLCAKRVGKSTINNRKQKLGYTDSKLGRNARK